MYFILKIFHIMSATLLLTSMSYCCVLWHQARGLLQIQKHTGFVIIPLAILQLFTGFTIISLQHEDIAQLWIRGSVISFMVMIISWLTCIYFLLLTPQTSFLRRVQFFSGCVCIAALLSMIFFMASKYA